MSIPTGDTLSPSITEPPLFWSSKLIHLVDCRKVEEEGIIQHRQLHTDTLLSTTSLRQSPIVGKCVCVCVCVCVCGVCVSIVELMVTGCLAFMELILGVVYMYYACVRGNSKRSSDRTYINHKPQTHSMMLTNFNGVDFPILINWTYSISNLSGFRWYFSFLFKFYGNIMLANSADLCRAA